VSDFRFAEPQFVHALWAVLGGVALLLWLDARGGSALASLVGPALQARLVSRPGAWRRRARIALLGLAAASAVLALMRPQWGMRVVSASRAGAEIMIALDVSKSMLAEDVAPNRLGRAKAEIVDLLAYLQGDQVGLIAFAGRASVLSPLTPDFGFLRLVLDDVGPGSVSRGGTRLAEPIRKAVEGFGPSRGASRAILLITDGEDHDSFALDAARAAAEAGIKIIAIGFGDEAGSEIRITDPRTGGRSLLRDASGAPVRSRLDGEALRELALATDGAYVPAGTGVLDLESIYDEHVARLTRGALDGTRTVRDEGYPWFVLLSLVFLISSASVSAGRLRAGALAGACLLIALGATPARAQQTGDSATPLASPLAPEAAGDPDADSAADPDADAAEASGGASNAVAVDPREVYNRGVAALVRHELEEAERLLGEARRDARGDDELRAYASYNLGWVSVQQSGRVQGEDPQQALQLLYRGADWFHEAVRLRSDDDEARRNLEVTQRRALVLADQIAQASTGGVEGELGLLTARQREVVSGVAQLLEVESAQAEADPTAGGEALRGEFRARSTDQRAVLADADLLAARTASERDAILARPEAERTPEDAMRAAQLAGVEEHLHRARERMGQARRQLRQRQGERGYRRASAALTALKRAQDQLRDPVAVLDPLLADGAELARGVARLSLGARALPGAAEALPPVPAWLTRAGLADDQAALADRAAELQQRFAAGLEGASAAGALPPEEAALLASVREAEPFVRKGSEQARRAAERLAAADPLEGALESQRRSLEALAEARERFLDVRGLVEALYGEEQQIAQVVDAGGREADAARGEYLPVLRLAQARNLLRSARLERKLEERAAALQQALSAPPDPDAVDPSQPPPDPARLAEEQQHVEVATKVLALAAASMQGARKGLGDDGPVEAERSEADRSETQRSETADWDWVRSDVAASLEHLETLRRLFFSIVEHLRDVARRQGELADRTQDALALAAGDAEPEAEAAPLIEPQRGLAAQSLAIANALEQQSRDAGGAEAAEPQAQEAATRLREAAEHVLLAQTEMTGAAERLAPPPDLSASRAAQDQALREIEQALAALEPPRDQRDPGEQGDPAEPQQGNQAERDPSTGQEPQSQESPAEQADAGEQDGGVDPAQLLQEVREREAQRRRERANRSVGYETVEKDW
jgi:Ca-activated chloride channel family protein